MTMTDPKLNGAPPAPDSGLPDTSRDDGPDTMPVLDLSAFTVERRARVLALAEEVKTATATVTRVVAEANEVMRGLTVDEHQVRDRAMAAKVTDIGLNGGEDELGQS